MKKLIIALSILALGTTAWAAPLHQGRGIDSFTGSFSTVEQWKAMVSGNSRIAGLYARHFGVTKEALIEADLAVGEIPQSGDSTVYCLNRRGTIYQTRQRLVAGEHVLVDAQSGRPLILADCGNPKTTEWPCKKQEAVICATIEEDEAPCRKAGPREPLVHTPATICEGQELVCTLQGFEAQSWQQPHVGLSRVSTETSALGLATTAKCDTPPKTCDPDGGPGPEQNPSGPNVR